MHQLPFARDLDGLEFFMLPEASEFVVALVVRWFEVLHAARGQLTLVSFPNRAVFFSPPEGVTSFAMVQPAACICFTKSERYHSTIITVAVSVSQ